MGERQCRHLRAVLSWCGAVARRRRASAITQGDGGGDDLLHPGELLVPRWRAGRVLARLGLAQLPTRPPPPRQCRRPEDRRGRGTIVGTRWRSGTPLPAAARAV